MDRSSAIRSRTLPLRAFKQSVLSLLDDKFPYCRRPHLYYSPRPHDVDRGRHYTHDTPSWRRMTRPTACRHRLSNCKRVSEQYPCPPPPSCARGEDDSGARIFRTSPLTRLHPTYQPLFAQRLVYVLQMLAPLRQHQDVAVGCDTDARHKLGDRPRSLGMRSPSPG
jgi:hypothetical protein